MFIILIYDYSMFSTERAFHYLIQDVNLMLYKILFINKIYIISYIVYIFYHLWSFL